MSLHWNTGALSPRYDIMQAMQNSGHSPTEPAAQAASFSFLKSMLNGRALPPVNENPARPTSWNGMFINVNPTPSKSAPLLSSDPYLSIRHETEHSMQPNFLDPKVYADAKEVGPSLGDVIHAGNTWAAVDPGANSYPVNLTPQFMPKLGTLMQQAKRNGYPARPMDELLSTSEGQQWLGQRMGEYGGVR